MGGRFISAVVVLAALALLGCGGGRTGALVASAPDPGGSTGGRSNNGGAGGLRLEVLHGTSGAPSGVRISWTRVDDAEVSGYYIYRDTTSLPSGDPAGYESFRINGGTKIDQSGSGNDTLTFDDDFSPSFGDSYYYRLTVANQTDDESDFSNEESITIAQHTVDSVTQSGGSIGDTVTIDGTHFGDARNGDIVYFTGSDGQTDVACASSDYISWSQTEIQVKIPYGAADGRVGVSVASLVVYSTDTIDYNEPTLTNLSPTEDYVQHDYVTLTGTDFGPSPGNGGTDTHIYFNGFQEQSADVDEASWTTTSIRVKVPAAATGLTVNVYVSVAGNDSGTQTFTLLPHIDGLIPSSGSPGTLVEIDGTNFGATQSGGTVRLKGYLATVTSWDNETILFTVPDKATDGNVVVLRSDGKSTSLGFDVVPTISSFTPTRRMEGEQLTITGSGFGTSRNGSTVRFLGGGGVDATNYISWSPTQIVLTVPVGAKNGQIQVNINDNSVGSDQDSATSTSNIAVLLPPPVINDSGQV